MYRWTWQAQLQSHQLAFGGGPFYSDSVIELLDQIRRAIESEWGNEPIYDGSEIHLYLGINGQNSP